MADRTRLAPWSARARNLPEHESNAIHTDAGARAAGFPSALVAGVTVYAYMTHVPAAAWGLDWVGGGGAQVRFRSPVFDGDEVDYTPTGGGVDDGVVEARVDGDTRSTCAVQRVGAHPERCTGEGDELEPIGFVADDAWISYAFRAGDDVALYAERGILHPVSWMRIANDFFHEQIVTGPWIHVRSHLLHVATAPVDAEIEATATVVDRFDSRAGERAILDVRIAANGSPVAIYEHEAIIRLAPDRPLLLGLKADSAGVSRAPARRVRP